MFFHHFLKGNNFCVFLFASIKNIVHITSVMGSALKGKNLLPRSKFFPVRVDPY